ncbi:MAG: phosphate ABC transporter permease subunit PstC [Clostridiales Family XIII bacterium]|jgi:phosphate transport system permease protein|nr:phosphate ABC transporter permease subunit PstC [Clostridiales Family XIII bacterium]
MRIITIASEQKRRRSRSVREATIERLLFLAGIVGALSVALITVFLFASGLPAFANFGLGNFLFETRWSPTNGVYGTLALTAGTLSVTLTALVIGIPSGVACAVFLSEILPPKAARAFKFAIELLAGIPSVVYGFFGLIVVVPAVRMYILPIVRLWDPDAHTTGLSILSGAIILAVMILPTIVSLSENAISSVPEEYKEASLALGANKRQTIARVLIPAAKSGILASIILGMGRAVGETMAVLLITGNAAVMPKSLLDPVATLTGTIAMEMSYADTSHQQALFAVGVILFLIIMLLNAVAQTAAKRMGARRS